MGTPEKSKIDDLIEQKKKLEEQRTKIEGSKISTKIFFFSATVILAIVSIVSINLYSYPIKLTLSITGSALLYLTVFPMIQSFFGPFSRINNQIFEIDNELDLLKIGSESGEKRAEKQFRIHQSELKRYYDQSLNHSKWIFLVGILSLVVGMAIIVLTLLLVFNSSEMDNNVIIAVTGGITGILTNFIAVIFLKMYSETVKSLNVFHERLVTTHHLHFGNFLVSKIFDGELKERTWAELALSLAKTETGKSIGRVRDHEQTAD